MQKIEITQDSLNKLIRHTRDPKTNKYKLIFADGFEEWCSSIGIDAILDVKISTIRDHFYSHDFSDVPMEQLLKWGMPEHKHHLTGETIYVWSIAHYYVEMDIDDCDAVIFKLRWGSD